MLIVVFLLFTNTFCLCFGGPVPPSSGNGDLNIGSSLLDVSKKFAETFLSKEISNQINNCNVTISATHNPHTYREIQCFMFLKISSQLFDSYSSAKVVLNEEEYKKKITEDIKIEEFCSSPKRWDIAEPPNIYHIQTTNNLTKLFENKLSCVLICSEEEELSENVNFYCKYSNLAMGFLHPQSNSTSNSETSSTLVKVTDKLGVQSVNNSTPKLVVSESSPQAVVGNIDKTNSNSPQLSSQSKPLGSSSAGQLEPQLSNKVIEDSSPGKVVSNNPKPDEDPEAVPDPLEPVEDGNELAVEEAKGNDNVEAVANKPAPLAVESAQSKPAVDKEKDTDQHDDDMDNAYQGDLMGKHEVVNENHGDGQKDGLANDQIEGEEDPLMKSESDLQRFKNKLIAFKEKTAPRDLYQESYTDDNNGFFPFFLTTVVIVVVLYILYHNKSKVSKVLLGYLVEGGRPRRRNSRGAYRRLDTLEHAISTSAAAAPSNIIY